MLRFLALTLLVAGCVGDSTVNGSDAGADATSDGGENDAPSDAASDAVGTSDAGIDASDAATCAPPDASLTANCGAPKVTCLRQNQTTCDNPGNCTYIGGGRQLLCGSNADCDGGAVCCASSATITSSGCPDVVSLNGNVSNIATHCSTSTTKSCASGDLQVCVTSAECVSGTCTGAVFDVNGTETVKLGVCQ